MLFEELFAHLETCNCNPTRPEGGNGECRSDCPACPPHTRPSLTFREGSRGQAIAHCHAGCTWEQIKNAIWAIVAPGVVARDLIDTANAPAAEDLADILRRPIQAPPWVVKELGLAAGDVVLFSGEGGSRKSWIALSTALALATGDHIFGHYAVTEPCRVAVLDLESQPWDVDQRLHRLAAGMHLNPDKVAGQVRVFRERLRLDGPDVERLIAGLRAWGTNWLVVDSLRRGHAGNENASEVVSGLFLTLDRIRATLGCGVILIDHTRKRTGDPALDAADQALRGSTDKRNMVDVHIGIEPREDNGMSFIPTKARHARLPDPIELEVVGFEEGAEDDAPVFIGYAGALDRTSDRVQDAVVAALETAGGALWRRDLVDGRLRYSQRSIEAALSQLVRRGRVCGADSRRPADEVFPLPDDLRNVRKSPQCGGWGLPSTTSAA